MNLTTKGRYAVMAMVDLAINGNDKPLCLSDISTRQDIALSYLEQIFMRLRKAGLVKSIRGPGGGYIMAIAPKDVAIADIVLAVDESIKMTRCSGLTTSGCINDHNKSKCMTHNLWEGLGNKIYEYLKSVSLADICNKNLPNNKRLTFMEEANV